MTDPRRSLPFLLALALVTVACERSSGSTEAFPNETLAPSSVPVPTRAPASEAASPTPPAVPSRVMPTSGPPGEGCVGGWTRPEEGTPDFTDPVGLIRKVAPFDGPYAVVDMRLFVGPESPPSEKGYLKDIRRWYVKLYAVDDWTYQGRFLIEQRRFGRGVVAVAPYDTRGFASPDWVGFQFDGSDPRRKTYERLPGKWRGIPYDFVAGGAGLTIAGLPADVVGCLDGT